MKRGQKAWLVTWEWSGPHAAVEDKIAAILPPRWSQKRVGEMVEMLYALHQYTPSELAVYSKKPKMNPYKVQYADSHCFCGHNPSLHANYVENLIIEADAKIGIETISWRLPPRWTLNNKTMEPKQVRGYLSKSIKRTITGPLSDREIGRYKM